MEQHERNLSLAKDFISSKGGTLPSYKYNIKVPGLGSLFCLPEGEPVDRYWVASTEILRQAQWHSPGCLMQAIEELPADEWDLLPVTLSTGETAKIHVVNQTGLMPLFLHNITHFDKGLSYLAAAWGYIVSQREYDYARIPDPLKTALQFWEIVDPGGKSRPLDVEMLAETFKLDVEEIRAIIEARMTKVWDSDRDLWVYKEKN